MAIRIRTPLSRRRFLTASAAAFAAGTCLAALGSTAMIELKTMAAGQVATYRVDARLLASPIRTPELEHDIHEAVQRNVQDLHHGRFEILRIEPIRGEGGTVAYYDVSVKP